MRRNFNYKTKKVPLKKNLGKLLKAFRPFYLKTILASIFILSSVVISILAPQFLKVLTDEIANNAVSSSINMNTIAKYTIILGTMYVFNAIFSCASGMIMNDVSHNFSAYLRDEISKKINRMKLKYFDSHQHGDTLSIVTNDIDTIAQSLQQSLTMLFQSIFMIVGVLIAMFITSYQMAFAVLISIPLMMVMMVIIMKFAIPLFKQRQELIAKVNGIVEENYTGQLLIKVFNAEENKSEAFFDTNAKLYKAMFKAQFFGGIMQPMMTFISYFAYASVCLVGGILIANSTKNVSFGTISAFLVYVNLFQNPLSQVAQSMNTIQMAAAASERVFTFLETEELDDESHKEEVFKDKKVEGHIEFKDVKFAYEEDKMIIKGFSLDVPPGSKVAIVGSTGSGKTTIVNLLMRFYEINSGDILIDGVSIKDISRKELRDLFSMVLQDTWMFEGTLRDNIVFNTKNVSEERILEVIEEANLAHYVNTLSNGIDTVLHEESSLSSGQRQLLTIARAMIENAPLLILDEATSNVDTRTEIIIQEAMDNLSKGKTSFVIAHRLSTIKNADLILVLKDGDIIETGNHDELMKNNGFYANLYNSQFEM